MKRRSLLITPLGGFAGLSGLGSTAQAQSYPTKPIRLVVTFPSAGAPDILARLFADKAQLGQPVVVDNVPGAGGNQVAGRRLHAGDGHGGHARHQRRGLPEDAL